jgi:hypothetical protein
MLVVTKKRRDVGGLSRQKESILILDMCPCVATEVKN